MKPPSIKSINLLHQLLAIIAGLLSIVTVIALLTAHSHDPSEWFIQIPSSHPKNLLGFFGAQYAAFLFGFFGAAAWLIAFFWLAITIELIFFVKKQHALKRISAAGFFVITMTLYYAARSPLKSEGGAIGDVLLFLCNQCGFFDEGILIIISWYSAFISFCLWWQFNGLKFFFIYSYKFLFILYNFTLIFIQLFYKNTRLIFNNGIHLFDIYQEKYRHKASIIENQSPQVLTSTPPALPIQEDQPLTTELFRWPEIAYHTPQPSLLKIPVKTSVLLESDKRIAEQKEHARTVEKKLAQFGIRGNVIHVTVGLLLTLFEYEPASDIKLSRIAAFEDDLALALKAMSVRIIAPLPGRAVVGIEVAYQQAGEVSFASIAHSALFQNASAHLPLILGEDVVGNPFCIDLTEAPHILVAGTTGSGKSVGLHSMIASLLLKKTPDELRLVLIDPKQLEFAQYEKIPHLCTPIITDCTLALPIFAWLVETMQKRYQIMAESKVRTIAEYNLRFPKNPFTYIVVVIDELADLMATAGKSIEEYLLRIAQMARAAGIHMIVATQRPSVDVLTGLIKVNFPTRIAFRVASKIDSRTIIDTAGAERLLGKGDLLLLSTTGALIRLHGAYITKHELETIVEYTRSKGAPSYLFTQQMMLSRETHVASDHLYNDVVYFLENVDEISISLIQREFKIGYNRSARLVSQLLQERRLIDIPGSKMKKVIKNSSTT